MTSVRLSLELNDREKDQGERTNWMSYRLIGVKCDGRYHGFATSKSTTHSERTEHEFGPIGITFHTCGRRACLVDVAACGLRTCPPAKEFGAGDLNIEILVVIESAEGQHVTELMDTPQFSDMNFGSMTGAALGSVVLMCYTGKGERNTALLEGIR